MKTFKKVEDDLVVKKNPFKILKFCTKSMVKNNLSLLVR